MRNSDFTDFIFDTRIDTQKYYVTMEHKFVLHNHVDKRGKSLLYLHISNNGRERIPLADMKIEPAHWDKKKQRAKRTAKHLPDFNLILENYEKKITEIKTVYRLSEIPLTLEAFVDEFTNKLSRTDFLAFMKSFLETNKATMKEGTHKNNMKVYRKLHRFRKKILFSEITYELIDKFKSFCASDAKGMAETSINGYVKIFKKYLNLAIKRGIKLPIDTTLIVTGTTAGNRVNLDGDEVDRLAEYFCSRFIKPSYIQPLGLFLLACFTGFRISDAQQITFENVENDRIIFTSIKTGKRQVIKINLTVDALLTVCPQILTEKHTDQHVNRVLKDVCDIVGITKKVTFHVARHTFATNFLRLGGKAEVLQKILGHSDITETMVYVHIVQEEQDRGMHIMDNLIASSHFSRSHANESA